MQVILSDFKERRNSALPKKSTVVEGDSSSLHSLEWQLLKGIGMSGLTDADKQVIPRMHAHMRKSMHSAEILREVFQETGFSG